MSEEIRPFLITIPIKVKTYDVDFAQIVHNAVYIRWLEDLRTEVLADTYSIEEMLADKISPILTRTEIDYLWPVRFGDEVVGKMWVSSLRRIKWEVRSEIWAGDEMSAASVQTGYFLDQVKMKPTRIPSKLQSAWDAMMA